MNTTSNHRLIFQLLIAIAVVTGLLSSCGSSRSVTGGKTSQNESAGNLKNAYTSLVETYDNSWTTLSVPVSVALRSPKTLKASGTLTMTRGKDIGISVRVLGIEVASLYLSGDSVWALDKWHKYYVAESISELLGGFPATVENVQDMLIGHAFVIGDSPLTAGDVKKFNLAASTGNWSMSPRKTPGNVEYSFVIADGGDLTGLEAVVAGRPVTCSYGAFTPSTPAGPVTSSTMVKATGGKTSVEAGIEWKFNKAKWNGAPAKPLTIPRGYTRIKAADLLKAIPSL